MPRNPWQEIQIAQQRREAHRENAARNASLYVMFETRGSGQLIMDEPVMFELPFFEEPSIAHGHALVDMPQGEFYELPRSVSGGVHRWEQNERGFYLGAYLYFYVDVGLISGVFPGSAPAADLVINHYFTFTEVAYKTMGNQVNDALRMDDSVSPLIPPIVP